MNQTKFREIKPEIRILGIDDCPFTPSRHGQVTLIGVVFRGGLSLDGAMRTEVLADGRDSSDKIVNMVKASPHYRQLRVIMVDSITVAGFNIVDLPRIYKETQLPIMSITRDRPNEEEVKRAIRNLPDWEDRWRIIEGAGEIVEIRVRGTRLYSHLAGVSLENAEEIIRVSSTRANFPEPLRVAHILAQGLGRKPIRSPEPPTNRNKSDKFISE